MILVVGPKTSGKSMTLYSMLQTLSSPKLNLFTIEDRLSYRSPGINQVELSPSLPSYADALRATLSQDPEIILLGEINASEAAR